MNALVFLCIGAICFAEPILSSKQTQPVPTSSTFIPSRRLTSIIDDYRGVDDVINQRKFAPVSPISLNLQDYQGFVQAYENYKGSTKHQSINISQQDWENLVQSYYVVRKDCTDGVSVNSYESSGFSISETRLITASHNVHCDRLGKAWSVSLIRAISVYGPSNVFSVDIEFDGIPEIDDIAILVMSSKQTKFLNFMDITQMPSVSYQMVPMGDPQYLPLIKQDIDVVCFGMVGILPQMFTIDGIPLNPQQQAQYFGPRNSHIMAIGRVSDGDLLLKRTCGYALRDGQYHTQQQCEDVVKKDKDFPLDVQYHVAYDLSVPSGMSGGVCVDVYNPLYVITIQSGGRELPVGPNHRYSVYNYGTLLDRSNPVKNYVQSCP